MRLTLAAALLTSVAGTAFAADVVVYEPVPEVVIQPFSWAGAYAGIHGGYAWGRQNDNMGIVGGGGGGPGPGSFSGSEAAAVADKFDVDGWLGGVHVGYNWQRGHFVWGIEGDVDYANIEGSEVFDFGKWKTGTLDFRSDWQGSLRLRLGHAVDTWLFYVTGGGAVARAKLTASLPGMSMSDSNTHWGWTIGAGVEKAFTPNWIGRLEVRHTDFGGKTYDLGNKFGTAIKSDWNQTAVTVGFSYKLN